jgi:hypothetical protein
MSKFSDPNDSRFGFLKKTLFEDCTLDLERQVLSNYQSITMGTHEFFSKMKIFYEEGPFTNYVTEKPCKFFKIL